MLHSLRRAVTVLAWTFLVGSVVPLVMLVVMSVGWVGEEFAAVFSTTNDEVTHSAWGLRYHGVLGSLLLWIELLAVPAMMWLASWRRARIRRIALGGLLAWSMLLLIGAWWVRSAADWPAMTGTAIYITLGFACVAAWAGMKWRGKSNTSTGQRVNIAEPSSRRSF